ncbi:MAG: hypothetical protein ABF291_07275, partial [Desulfobacterales bacterium]
KFEFKENQCRFQHERNGEMEQKLWLFRKIPDFDVKPIWICASSVTCGSIQARCNNENRVCQAIYKVIIMA